jgi:hypothetical protein
MVTNLRQHLLSKPLGEAGKDTKGFQLTSPQIVHYRVVDGFRESIHKQREDTIQVDALHLKRIGLNGELVGTDWRLHNAAFGDLCNFCNCPSGFVKRLSRIDEALALDVMNTLIETVFHSGPEKSLVIDGTSGAVFGIVGTKTYTPITNEDTFDWAMSALPDAAFTNGWMEGPKMRFTLTKGEKPIEPKKGDIIKAGISVENAINGDASCLVNDYLERLVCTNGMVHHEAKGASAIRHQGDAEFKVQKAVCAASQRVDTIAPLLAKAADLFLDAPSIEEIRRFIADSKNGGNVHMDVKVAKGAMRQAQQEGRPEEEVTLYNFVNAVTELAHEATNIERKVSIESLGYKVLTEFATTISL